MRRVLLLACLALFSVSEVQSSQVHFRKLEDMIGSINVVALATVRSVEERHGNRYQYVIDISKCLAGQVTTNRLSISYYATGSPKFSLYSPASGIEHNLKTGEKYLFLFKSIEPQGNLGAVLVRAEPVERQDAVMKAWRENRKQETNKSSSIKIPRIFKDKLEKINYLIDRMAEKPEPIKNLKELTDLYKEKLKTDPEWVREYSRKRRNETKRFKAEQEKIADELSRIGEKVIDPMLQKYKQTNYSCDKVLMIRVLGNIATPKSQQILKDMALGHGIFDNKTSGTAAQSYIKSLKDKRKAIELLDCSDRNVKSKVLQGLKRVPIDAVLFEKVSPYLMSKDIGLRTGSAIVFAADPDDQFVSEKVEAIVKSIETTQDLPGANEKYQNKGTLKETVYISLAGALSIMKGADDAITEALKELKGEPRLYVSIAMAARGDVSFKNDLWETIRKQDLGISTRSYALTALGKIGDKDDLDELKKLSEQDDLMLADWKGNHLEMRGGKIISENLDDFPWSSLDMEEVYDDVEKHGRKYYPIRNAAKEAIKIIKDRKQLSAGY